jgi:hypothetical protein
MYITWVSAVASALTAKRLPSAPNTELILS